MSGCGFVTKQKGKEVLCGRPCSAWRWYQNDARHDTGLVAVCDWHGNEGGRRMHAAEALLGEAYAEDSGLALWSEHPDAIREFREEYLRDIYGEGVAE